MSDTTSALARPVPHPTELTRPFWDACNQGRLTVQRCENCGRFVFTPQEFCRFCRSRSLSWVVSSGSGRVVTFTVVWRPQTPAFTAPYVVAVIELDEGYQMISNVIGDGAEQVRIGDRVGVRFLPVSPDIVLPCFERVA